MMDHYFAAANTTEGFVSYYSDIFKDIDRLYVIKGGSGTGKSRLMRELGDEANKRGNKVEWFLCSFDPDSLDGILINGKTAIIDGTAPHVYEPTLPGARDNIIDLGRFWDSDILFRRKKEISELGELKRECFDIAYIYLSAVGNLIKVNRNISHKYFNSYGEFPLFFKEFECSHFKHGGELLRLDSAFGRNGAVRTDHYTQSADRIINISDEYGTYMAEEYIDALMIESAQRGILRAYSYSPFEVKKPNAVLLCGGLAAVKTEENGDVDVSEFMRAGFRNEKKILSENTSMCGELISKAESMLSKAANYHSEIESIYISAMDFNAKEKYTKDLIEALKY